MLIPQQLDLQGEVSDVLYFTGISKAHSEDDIQTFLMKSNKFVEIQLEPSKLWVRYASIPLAVKSQAYFHQQSLNGCTVMCRFELGFCKDGKRLVSRKAIHTTVIRRIQHRKSAFTKSKKNANGNDKPPKQKKQKTNSVSTTIEASYSSKSLILGEMEYPFPSGLYLSRLIGLLQKWPRDDPLVELVSNTERINKYSKEISESMAMVDAVERATKLCLGQSAESLKQVRVYCVGDGKQPLTATTMALSYPYPNWEFVSIDPILEPISIHKNCNNDRRPHRMVQVAAMSQDYEIPKLPPPLDDISNDLFVEIVIACHSHAPLQEFWNRLLQRRIASSHRALAITMACCANYSDLIQKPILVFDDYEVYSAKRTIKIYNDSAVDNGNVGSANN